MSSTSTLPLDLKKGIAESREKYREFLKGKRVVIVGPAPTIKGSKQHDLIENYDVIVRLNKALPIPEKLIEDVGERTDVLYNCMNPSSECGGKIDANGLSEAGVKFLVSPYAPLDETRFKSDIETYLKKNGQTLPFCHIDRKYFVKLLQTMKLPNTGVNAILDLLRHEIKELYITGFTFFKGGYIKEYRGYDEKHVMDFMAKHNLHDQQKQLIHMKKVLRSDPRIRMDKGLAEIINDKNIPSRESTPTSSSEEVALGIFKKPSDGPGRKVVRKLISTKKPIYRR